MASRLGRVLVRRYADAASGAAHETHEAGLKRWKLLCALVAMPGVVACYVNSYLKEAEHTAEHQRPEFVPYEHLFIRSKPFPWGDGNKSLIHNPHLNALPEGYES